MELYISLIVVWLVIFVVSVIIEACTTELVSIWFSAGSIIALILSAIPNVPFYIPIIVFIVISLTLLLCLRPIIKKMLNKNTLNSNIDEIETILYQQLESVKSNIDCSAFINEDKDWFADKLVEEVSK